jgi:hypothetical protein
MHRVSKTLLIALSTTLLGGGGTALAASSKPAPDLAGVWRFDPSRSNVPRPPGGGHHGGGGWGGGAPHGGGGWGAGGGGGFHGGPPPDADSTGARPRPPGGRQARLPDLLTVVQTADYVRMEDSTGSDVLLILTTTGGEMPQLTAAVPEFQGTWKGQRLEAKHEGDRGSVQQSYEVKDKGQTLEVKTKLETPRGTMEIKRVYERVST